jgi:hypothetical protein
MKLEDAMSNLDEMQMDGSAVARAIYTLPGILDILSNRVAFYSVAYGETPGIYENWCVIFHCFLCQLMSSRSQAQEALGNKVGHPRHKKFTTLRDALIFIVLKGDKGLIQDFEYAVSSQLSAPNAPQQLDKKGESHMGPKVSLGARLDASHAANIGTGQAVFERGHIEPLPESKQH